MVLIRFALLALVSAAAVAVFAQPRESAAVEPQAESGQEEKESGQLSRDALDTLSMLHLINRFEVAAAQLATQNSQNARVRRYGEQLIRDHRQSDSTMREFLERRNARFATPTPRDGLGEERIRARKETLDRLRGLQGPEFDQEFLPAMAAGHEYTIQLVQEARNTTEDAAFRGLLGRLLPLVQQQRDLAMLLSADIGTEHDQPAQPDSSDR
jgi:putative membrane protein